jgi:hypothetical protein
VVQNVHYGIHTPQVLEALLQQSRHIGLSENIVWFDSEYSESFHFALGPDVLQRRDLVGSDQGCESDNVWFGINLFEQVPKVLGSPWLAPQPQQDLIADLITNTFISSWLVFKRSNIAAAVLTSIALE